MRYKLLAVDLDGTLIGADQTPLPGAIDALADAEAAGLRVCLATGRAFRETIGVWRRLRLRPPHQPLVLVGGALVAEPDTGRTLYQRTIPRELAWRCGEAFLERGHSAVAIVDAWRHGVEYYLAESADGEDVAQRWFSKMQVQVRRVRRLSDAKEMPDPLRVSALVAPDEADPLAAALASRFAGELHVQAIFLPNYGVKVVEALVPRANKWAALRYVAQGLRLGPGEIAAIGDDVNDLPMIAGAGLGAAMPHAPDAVRAAADHVASSGVAAFVRDILSGGLDPGGGCYRKYPSVTPP